MWGCEEKCVAWAAWQTHPESSQALIRASAESLQEADIWWVSFRKVIINTVFWLCRTFWAILAKIINPCCCRGLTSVPHTQEHVHPDSFSTILLYWCLQGLRGTFFGGMQQAFHQVRAWRGTPLTTTMQDASSPPEEFLQYLLWHQQQRTLGFQFCWEFLSLLALLRSC